MITFEELRNREFRRLLDNISDSPAIKPVKTLRYGQVTWVWNATGPVARVQYSTVCDPERWGEADSFAPAHNAESAAWKLVELNPAARPVINDRDLTAPIRENAAQAERDRIRSLLATFCDDNVSQRRDTDLERRARNRVLEEIIRWLADGAQPYTPKD